MVNESCFAKRWVERVGLNPDPAPEPGPEPESDPKGKDGVTVG